MKAQPGIHEWQRRELGNKQEFSCPRCKRTIAFPARFLPNMIEKNLATMPPCTPPRWCEYSEGRCIHCERAPLRRRCKVQEERDRKQFEVSAEEQDRRRALCHRPCQFWQLSGALACTQIGCQTDPEKAVEKWEQQVAYGRCPNGVWGPGVGNPESTIENQHPQPPASNPRNLILHSDVSPGDDLTLTAAVESLHLTYPGEYMTDVRTNTMAIWEHNPRVTRLEGSEAETIEMHYPSINRCNQEPVTMLAGYTEYLAETIGRPLRLRVNRPYIYLSEKEKTWLNQVEEKWAEQLAGRRLPFWLICAGIKDDYTTKAWPHEYYQEVIDRTVGRIQWVQIGASEHSHSALERVLDLRQMTDHRQLIRLAWHARGGLGPVTYLQHLMAAFEKPYICLLGGREPVPWVQYPKQITLHTIGALDCCRDEACWASRVVPLNDGEKQDKSLCRQPVLGLARPVGRCMAMIRPNEVLAVLEKHNG